MVGGLIVHVTGLLILAFFILFAASKADGLVSTFGRVLAVWIFVLAVLFVVFHVAPGLFGMKGSGRGMHDRWTHPWCPPPPGTVAQPAAPNQQ